MNPPASGLYVHVPFCLRKCAYCDFYSEVPSARPDAERDYAELLGRELASLPELFDPETVYLGGGTPSALSLPVLQALLKAILSRTPHAAEITCEVNPGTLTEEKAKALRDAGVNRVSLGAQSFDDRTLAFLGRIHRAEEIGDACRMLRHQGIDNLSLDLIYGLPPSISHGPEDDLERLIELAPDHISCYALTYEPGTPLYRDLGDERFRPLDDETCRNQYDAIRARLKAAGYIHYELSNFALPGRECRHNLIYWTGGDYIGVGPAAHSYWQGRRYGYPRDWAAWHGRVECGGWNPAAEEELDEMAPAPAELKCQKSRADPGRDAPAELKCQKSRADPGREWVVLGLRLLEGVSLSALRERTGLSLEDLYDGEVERLIGLGMLVLEGDRLRLTEEALFISNAVFSELI
ncbi:MAG: radical SAM family heme chaperone HemW [Kiritimatiellae bacterium]|nr:radical SAM family heme chaperone HemW [Kiritimatiellia bacterium]